MSHKTFPVLMLMLVLLAGLLAGCQSQARLAGSSDAGISVGITAETCPNVAAQVGQKVTWTNQDSASHIVKATPPSGSGQFDSGILKPGDVFAFSFPETGTFPYTCSEDGTKTGTVTITQ